MSSFFRQEKYLQQIQAAILERDAEAPRVDSIRVTGKMARPWRLGADQLFVFFFINDIEITVLQGDFVLSTSTKMCSTVGIDYI